MDLRYERLVVPVAGTPADDRVLAVVPHLVPTKQPVTLTLIYVVEVAQAMPLDAELPAQVAHGVGTLQRAETEARRTLGSKGVQIYSELLQARSIGAAVVDEAIERGADAIVMTARVQRKHGRPTLGDTVNYIMLNAPCEVLVIRLAPSDEESGAPLWR
jgi:nucleotide-binding universal stress UspA family protein